MNSEIRVEAVRPDENGSLCVKGRFRVMDSQSPKPGRRLYLGWQAFDPETGLYLFAGEWQTLPDAGPNGCWQPFEARIALPEEDGSYRFYLSLLEEPGGWHYMHGSPFVALDLEIRQGKQFSCSAEVTTLRRLNWRRRRRTLQEAFSEIPRSLWRNRRLIRSMVRRDIQGRYRGSAGDVLWTVLNPLLLMATYYFVFGVVLQTRFGNDPSRAGFVLYFLAGMLPWLAISEAAARAPAVVVEHRNYVKKLLFPVEVLPAKLTISGLVTGAFATAVFLLFLLLARGAIPPTVIWLPALLVPQLLLTLGICWFLAALGVFLRDLSQIIGFALTLWFFLTPICYPEESLRHYHSILSKNPLHVLVAGYRAILLESRPPEWASLAAVTGSAAVLCLAGQVFFHKARRGFTDIL